VALVALVAIRTRGSRRCSMCSPSRRCWNRRGCSPRSIRRFAGGAAIEAQDSVLGHGRFHTASAAYAVVGVRATLEEVQRATLILQVSDASSPVSAEQDAQVESVLKELEADKKPRLRVMNKIDLLLPKQRESLRVDWRDDERTIHVSAAKGIGLTTLLDRIDAVLEGERPERVRLAHSAKRGRCWRSWSGRSNLFAPVSGWDGWCWRRKRRRRWCGGCGSGWWGEGRDR